jgi:enoyl-CoA hydratase
MGLLDCAVAGGVAWITLADPDRRNILSGPLVGELTVAFDRLEARDDVAAAVITGAGKAFCAGADLGDLQAAAGGDTAGVETVYKGFLRVRDSPLVTIAAVNGPAVGAGLNLALACDVRLAARSAWFDTRFLRIGLHPGGGHLWLLERAVGPQTAAAMALLGLTLGGDEAARLGLAWRCVPDDELPAVAGELAARVAGVDVALARRAKESLRDVARQTHAQALAAETERQFWSLTLPSTQDALLGRPAR